MPTKHIGLSAILFCCVLSWSSITFADFDKDITAKKNQLSSITDHIQLLQKTLAENQEHQENLQQELKTDEIKISQTKQQMHALNQQLAAVETELTNVKTDQQTITLRLTKQQDILGQQVRMIYQLGKTPALKALLNPQDINTTNRHMMYYHYLNQAHFALMADIKQTVDSINKNMAVIVEREKNLSTLLAQKQQQQAQLENAQQKRSETIAELNSHNKNKQEEILSLTENQKNLQSTLNTLQNTLATVPASNPSFKIQQEKFQWPLKGSIATEFGSHQEGSPHFAGIVINAPEGTPVHAIAGGKVIFANWLRGFGLLVIINHGNGYMSLYARNQALYANVGDTVQPGEAIASIGNTGGFAKTSLYFEIRHNGAPINPHIWCA